MKSGRPNHKETVYSTSDIQKYLRGELSAREMHELEKAALEDPFLADALDGVASRLPAFEEDMTGLQQRLAEKIAPARKRIPLFAIRRVRVAAVLIGLAGLGG